MIELLRTVPLFASLKKKEIGFLAEIAREVEYPANTVLFHEGDIGDRLYIIIDGQLEAVKALGSPGEHLLRVCPAGDYVGEMCFFNPSGARSATVRTQTLARLLELKRDDFEALLHRRPSVAYAIAQGLTQRMLDSESRFLRALAEKDHQLSGEHKQGHIAETGGHDLEAVGPYGQADDQHKTSGHGITRIQIKTFGDFRVFRGEALIGEQEWKAKQPQLLLKAIITRGVESVPKDVLIEDLWPEISAVSAENRFGVVLHRLRKVLEPSLDRPLGSSYVVLKKNLVSLRKDLCQVDLDEFMILRQRGRKAEDAGDIRRAMLCYRSCIDLYRGDFLSEDLYAPWAEPKRNELRAMYLDLLYRMAELYETQRSSKKAIECYKSIIKADPAHEEVYQKLMLIYSNRGMRAEALKVYEECKKALKDQVGVEPCRLTVSIYKKIMENP
ncbi:MAG: BTAD domain-containing putative transcriptional regulator [Syntrophobacteraceae bacterium]|jgi:DNA-binding SARP family transcriptional activator/CRP-like cAMP-binding protein